MYIHIHIYVIACRVAAQHSEPHPDGSRPGRWPLCSDAHNYYYYYIYIYTYES